MENICVREMGSFLLPDLTPWCLDLWDWLVEGVPNNLELKAVNSRMLNI